MRQFESVEVLRLYVKETLCGQQGLEPNQFPLEEALLVRRGVPCGLYFCQRGPRQMRAHAIWDERCCVIAFYDSSGCRFHKETVSIQVAADQEVA